MLFSLDDMEAYSPNEEPTTNISCLPLKQKFLERNPDEERPPNMHEGCVYYKIM
jgi:hypothetical protein